MIKNKKEYKRDGEYAMNAVVVVLIISLLLMLLTPLNP
jgi:competence protein ComGC